MTERPPVPPREEVEPGQETPAIYVASLSDYNDGFLHGVWLDADDTVEGLQEGIDVMLATSPTARLTGQPAEEWAIHDYENWGGIRLSEYESLEAVSRMGLGIGRHGEAFKAWVSLLDDHDTVELGMERFEDCYIGHWGSLEDYGDETLREIFGLDLDELPGVPDGLRQYVTLDAAGWARDATINGEIQSVEGDGGVYVFYGTC